jgi:hypothetical protein
MELWSELHKRALKYKGEDDTSFLLEFALRIPQFNETCRCKEEWMNIVKENPPRFGKKEYFAWTVEIHNEISKKLNKPTYTLDDAKLLYSKKKNKKLKKKLKKKEKKRKENKK